ncbi:MAG: UbiA family prenyltransferase, partial [Candidatus Thermoplasmatota archaeon]|nr:UbiA family prenyltransferase [Candidatus Thermoplasmatota archaeon]
MAGMNAVESCGHKKRGKGKAYLDLMRPLNCIMAGVATILSVFIALGGNVQVFVDLVIGSSPGFPPFAVLHGFAIAFLFTFAGNALNDYYDREVDKKNHPNRPIPRGDLMPVSALRVSALVFAVIIAWSFFITMWAFVIVATSAVVMVSYETRLKASGLPGNLSIAWLTGCAFLFGGSVVDRIVTVGLMALLAFLASIGREIIKDVEDMGGDEGRHTLPMRIGARKASLFSATGFAGAVLMSPLPYLMGIMGLSYLFVVVAADVMFIYSGVIGFSS